MSEFIVAQVETDDHQRRNDAQLAAFRAAQPAAWARLLEQLGTEERAEVERRAGRAEVDQAHARRRDGESVADALARLGREQEIDALAAELERLEVVGFVDAETNARCAREEAERIIDALLGYAAEWDAAPGQPQCGARRFAPLPERVGELARRGPAEVTRRFGTVFLSDGSQWDASGERLVLAYPPDCCVSETGAAVAEARARALWGFAGTAGELRRHIAQQTREA